VIGRGISDDGTLGALPFSYAGTNSRDRIRTCISRSTGEVTVVFTTGQTSAARTRRGTCEESRLGARNFQVLCASGLRPGPWNSDPRQGRRSARRSFGAKYLSSFTTGKTFPLGSAGKNARAASASQPGNMDHGWGLEPRPELRKARHEVAVNFTTD